MKTMKTSTVLLLALITLVCASESPEMPTRKQSSNEKSALPVEAFFDCSSENCPFPVSISSSSEEAMNAEAEAFELDKNLLQLREEINFIRAKIAQIRNFENSKIRFQFPVRQIRNQLKMANRFGKRDKLRMSNRFG